MGGNLTVRGGVGGVEAHYDDMVTTARLFGRAATETGEQAVALHGYLVHPDVVAAAGLDPIGAGDFSMRLLTALDGPHGVSLIAVRGGAIDMSLRAAAAAYLEVDRLSDKVEPYLDALDHLPDGALKGLATMIRTRDPLQAAERVTTSDPWLADVAASAVAGQLMTDVPGGTRLLGGLFDDGTPLVTAHGPDPGADVGGPPRSVADLVAGLDRRNGGRPGDVDVRIVEGAAAGRRQVIVDIPGTKNWGLGRRNGDITSPATNLRGLAGETTSYERGVIDALRQAGVGAGDDITLIGHSEGGVVAVNTAIHLAGSKELRVGHVITAGSPVGEASAELPPGVQLLAIENANDVVPHLDGAPNRDRTNVVTVTAHHGDGTIGGDHEIHGAYLPAARDIDASADPSIRAYLAGLGGPLGGMRIRTEVYNISRTY